MKINANLRELISRLEEYPYLYLCSAAGTGKTTLLKQFEEWARSSGKECLYLNMEKEEEQKRLLRFLEEDALRRETILLADQFERVEEEMCRRLADLMENEIKSGKLLFASRRKPQAAFFPYLWQKRMKELDGPRLMLDRREILEAARESKIRLNRDQAEQLYQWSGGWPSILKIVFYVMEQEAVRPRAAHFMKNPLLIGYIEKNIWSELSEEQQKLCKKLAVLSYIPESGGEEENLWDIQSLTDLQLMEHTEKGKYVFRKFWKDFLLQEKVGAVETVKNLENAGDRMRKEGRYREALDYYYRGGNAEKHRACMTEAFETLFWDTSHQELKTWLDFSMWEEESDEALFLRGMLLLDDGEFEEAEKIISVFRRRCGKEKAAEGKAGLFYLNMLYYFPEKSAREWLNEAQAVAEQSGTFRLFSFNCAMPGCLCTGRDLSELFCCRKNETERYRQQWNQIFEPEQRDLFTLAEAEYLMESNRMEEAFKKITPFLVMDERMPADRMEILFGLLCNLFMRGAAITGYEELAEEYYRSLTARDISVMEWNVTTLKICYDIWRREAGADYKLLLGNDSENYRQIDRHNCYYLLNKARNYLFVKQCEKAYMLFGRLGEYYNKHKLYRFRTECCIGQAVAAFAMEEETQALKLLNVAMATADQFRYVGIFGLFGNSGKNLIDKYNAVTFGTGSGTRKARAGKRSYYYGNVVGVSFENYMKVLTRAVRRNASRYPFERLENEDAGEKLTMTEAVILQYVERGYANSEIARELNIELTTVKKHIYNIYKKLGVNNRVQAIRKGKMLGILTR
ncbi:MAG: LuxR C-terminal-related transcriptional regulator [Eubacteriales bacterium]|nr:LuxR C-terminal-related transcriptional regulator [Eubacteriales bacterium]